MFEVGQKVWDVVAGEGTVTAIENGNHYPVVAKFSNGSERTYSTDGKSVKSDEPPSLYPYPVEIVKKVVKPSIDWEHVAHEFNYLAEDSGGGAFLYGKEPFVTASSVWCAQSDETVEAIVFASYTPGTCDWKDSLVARPKDA
jgi:hypothetical protein